MRKILVITGKDLRQRLRDKTAYIVGLAAPLLLATLINLAFGGSNTVFHATYAVVDQDHGALAHAFVHDVLGSKDLRRAVTTRIVSDPRAAEALARQGKISAAFILPAGFSDQSRENPVDLEVIRSDDINRLIGADVAVSIAQSFTARLQAVRLSIETVLEASTSSRRPFDAAAVPARAQAQAAPIDELEHTAYRSDVPAGSTFAPGMGIFFLYYVVGFGAMSMMAERREGTLARLLAAPVPSRSVLVAKALGAFVLGLASLSTLAISSSILLDARWGDLVSATVLIVVTVFAVTGVAAMVLALARTEAQVRLSFSLVTFVFALLGGNFINLANAPDFLQRLSLLTPNGWALRAFGDLGSEGGGIGSVLPAVFAILAFGVVSWSIGIARSRRLVTI